MTGSKADIAKGYHNLLASIQNNSAVEIANRIFVKQDFSINQSFNLTANNDFNAAIQSVDFTNAALAAKNINDFAANETHGLITNLISPDSITPQTEMILVNAIYFKGSWVKPFNKAATAKATFNSSSTSSAQIDTMYITVNIYLIELQLQNTFVKF